MKRLDKSEIGFKIGAYLLLTVFALLCLYPFIYAVSGAISSRVAMDTGQVTLFPIGVQWGAFSQIFRMSEFWITYSNTIFVTFYGTLFSVVTTIMGAYTLSKRHLPFRSVLSFFIVFTMWFTAGFVPQFFNYRSTAEIFGLFTQDEKWLVVFAMGMAALNVVLLRNAFDGVPKEIEEAAIVDGATEVQLMTKVYVPMAKAGIATITLFYAISRWNGFFWADVMISDPLQSPLQVFIRRMMQDWAAEHPSNPQYWNNPLFSGASLIYAMVIVAIIPIIVVYPYIQRYFAKGVNMGGVKE